MCNFFASCFSCCCCGQEDIDFQSVVDSSNRLLIFVNPKSGSGIASKIFKQKIFPILTENSISFELIQTDFAGHAAQVISERQDLLDFNAIVIVSGDGLVFEVLNALVLRKDSKLLTRLPFAIIPCGSGNGLLSAVFAHRQQPIDEKQFLTTAIETLADPDAIALPVNLVQVQTDERSSLASFLSIGWGLMADIDIESESLRTICGGNRFFWGALWRVAMLRTHKARLSFLEVPTDLKPSNIDPVPVYRQGPSPITNEKLELDRNEEDIWKQTSQIEVPDLESPVPSQWKTVDDEFLMVYAVSVSHISNINVYAPNAKLNERQIHLTYILKKDIRSKAEVAKFLTAIETQKHLDLPFCHYVKVQAFRLELDAEARRSPIVVDGEVISETKIQAIVSDLFMRVVSK